VQNYSSIHWVCFLYANNIAGTHSRSELFLVTPPRAGLHKWRRRRTCLPTTTRSFATVSHQQIFSREMSWSTPTKHDGRAVLFAVALVVASTSRTGRWVNYTYWHKTAAHTYRLGLFYNVHLIYMQVCETFLIKKLQTVMWHCECEQSIHVQQPRGLGLKASQGQDFSQGQGQGQDLHEVSSRIEAKARPGGQQDCKIGKSSICHFYAEYDIKKFRLIHSARSAVWIAIHIIFRRVSFWPSRCD